MEKPENIYERITLKSQLGVALIKLPSVNEISVVLSSAQCRVVAHRTGQRSTCCGYRFRGCSDNFRYAIVLHADDVFGMKFLS